MAEEQGDPSQKTEEPTQKKLDDAREKGQVPTSREVNHLFMIFAVALIVMVVAPTMMFDMQNILVKFLAQPHQIPTDSAELGEIIGSLALQILAALTVPLLILIVAAILSGLVQTGFIFSGDRLKPKLEKISLMKGAKRLFSSQSLTEFAKGLFKIAIVASVATLLMLPELSTIEQASMFGPLETLDYTHFLVIRLLVGVVSVITVIAALDFMYVKFKHLKDMRMSRQDIKDEHKQSEGDPMVRQRLRQIRQERARSRMMAAVPESTVIVTNPTHYSIALKYVLNEMTAPIVVAKGIDHLAMRIREVAREHNIPLVENRAVAQALYAGVEIDQEVPPEHYKAVAEIISYVMRLKGGK